MAGHSYTSRLDNKNCNDSRNYGSARGGNHRISLDVNSFRRNEIIARDQNSGPHDHNTAITMLLLFLPIKALILRVMNGTENFYQAKRRSCLVSILLLSAVAFLT